MCTTVLQYVYHHSDTVDNKPRISVCDVELKYSPRCEIFTWSGMFSKTASSWKDDIKKWRVKFHRSVTEKVNFTVKTSEESSASVSTIIILKISSQSSLAAARILNSISQKKRLGCKQRFNLCPWMRLLLFCITLSWFAHYRQPVVGIMTEFTTYVKLLKEFDKYSRCPYWSEQKNWTQTSHYKQTWT